MSDDGTNAAKKIAYVAQLEGGIAQAAHALNQMRGYGWPTTQELEMVEIHRAIEEAMGRTQELMNSFYKVIGEA